MGDKQFIVLLSLVLDQLGSEFCVETELASK